MNAKKIISSAISYLFTFFAGFYGLCIVDGEIDFFTILGFIACVVVAVLASPLLATIGKKERKGF